MSPNINSFVGDLVEMARAMEELPGIKQALANADTNNAILSQAVADREERILNLKGEIDSLQSTIRALEVARDDAELRFLEADDRTQRALGFVKTMFGSAGGLIQSLEPPVMPESISEKLVEAQAVTEGAGESNPTGELQAGLPEDTISLTDNPSNVDSWASGPGQSEPLPSASTGELLPNASMTPATDTEHVGSTSTETSFAKPSGRYSGKRYYHHHTYVTLDQWLAEGGTEEDYNWRPGRPISNIG